MSLEPGVMDYERTISALDASIAATPHQAPPPPQRTTFTKLYDSLAFFFPIFAPVFGILKGIFVYLLKNLFRSFKVDAKFAIIFFIFLILLLLYIFWGLVQAICILLITIMTTTTSAVSTIGSIGRLGLLSGQRRREKKEQRRWTCVFPFLVVSFHFHRMLTPAQHRIEGLMKDVVHIQDLTDLIKSIRAMIDKDEIIWRELLEGSEKFLNLQGFAKEGRDWEIGDGSMIFVKRKTEDLYNDMGDQKKRAGGGKWGKWLGKGNGGKEDEEDEKEKSGQRILELRQWGKDVRKWASLRQEFSRSLKDFVEKR